MIIYFQELRTPFDLWKYYDLFFKSSSELHEVVRDFWLILGLTPIWSLFGWNAQKVSETILLSLFVSTAELTVNWKHLNQSWENY